MILEPFFSSSQKVIIRESNHRGNKTVILYCGKGTNVGIGFYFAFFPDSNLILNCNPPPDNSVISNLNILPYRGKIGYKDEIPYFTTTVNYYLRTYNNPIAN